MKKFWSLLGLFLVTLIGIFAGALPGSVLELFPALGEAFPVPYFALQYFSFIGIWFVFLGIMFFKKDNRDMLKLLWTKLPGNNWKMFLLGWIVFGFGINAACVLGALLNKDISLSFNEFSLFSFVLFLVTVFVQSSAEELVCRVYIFQKLRKLFPDKLWVPMVLNGVFFSLVHIGNDGISFLSIANILLVAILYSLLMYYTNSVWLPMAAHAGWNFTQNILFGLPNSGRVALYSVFKLNAASATNSIFYNTAFGVEGTVFATLLLAIACVGVYFYFRNKETNPLL